MSDESRVQDIWQRLDLLHQQRGNANQGPPEHATSERLIIEAILELRKEIADLRFAAHSPE